MIRYFPSLVASLLAAALLTDQSAWSQPLVPKEWPHLRGPNCDAVSTETSLADSWPATGPRVVWACELGQGYSGFVAADGLVFTQYQTRLGQFVVALNADTGVERWRSRVDWPWQAAGAYPGPYATPTWHSGWLYYTTPAGLVGGLNASDGRTRWSIDVRKTFRGRGTEFGLSATPLIEGDRVILPVGGPEASVVALNAADGSTAWTAGEDAASYCPILPISLHGRRRLVALLRNSVAIHDPETGAVVWRQELSNAYDEHSAWPLYAEPHLLVSSPFRRGAELFELRANATGVVGRSLWTSLNLSNDVCSSVLIGGFVYGFDLHQLQASAHRPSRGRFKCLDLATGAIRWETDRVGQATVLAADGKLILLTDTGTLILARATPVAFQELARCQVLGDGVCWTPPMLYRGRLVVRNHRQALCVSLDASTGLATNGSPTVVPPSSIDWTFLLPREPEFPHDQPTIVELTRWFGWCYAVFAAAGVAAGTTALLARRWGAVRPNLWARAAFSAVAFLLGLLGTTAVSEWSDSFVLTWPASLYVAFRVTLAAGAWAKGRQLAARLVARTVLLTFAVSCYAYYLLCLTVGYVMAWTFLVGFLPAAPMALFASHVRNPWLRALVDLAAFGVYFWVSGIIPSLKNRWFG